MSGAALILFLFLSEASEVCALACVWLLLALIAVLVYAERERANPL